MMTSMHQLLLPVISQIWAHSLRWRCSPKIGCIISNRYTHPKSLLDWLWKQEKLSYKHIDSYTNKLLSFFSLQYAGRLSKSVSPGTYKINTFKPQSYFVASPDIIWFLKYMPLLMRLRVRMQKRVDELSLFLNEDYMWKKGWISNSSVIEAV